MKAGTKISGCLGFRRREGACLGVKNVPANAGGMGSFPGPGRSHMPRSSWAGVLVAEPCSTREGPAMRRPSTIGEESLLAAAREKPIRSNKDPAQPKGK